VWGNTAIRHRGCVSWRIKRDTREAGTGCLMLADSFDKSRRAAGNRSRERFRLIRRSC
jgi:hypothetical protein